ncbi:unnamed protein product [Rotaria socialis]|uniref:Uncharacterized protein n=1 Tax=Rotaria socialis TaxID=392032 RepID=A0A820S479_9BILA|nr:unnamed protein product [Rotaria socialis]CAF3414256.1 unnamed protein product [Rotaria socialis]CAF3476297.1 unnamed protein product [Rotaria socialis]CAF3492472.1 unnamed protein product [Rotaria socialis]CAF4103829.1 unnamed protein product [Rotaria socialis]
MYNRGLFITIAFVFTCRISGEKHELIYNKDIVYYDECRISISPRNHLQPVNAYVQIQKPCNGTLLWTYPKLHLKLTVVNLENEPFTLCFEQKSIEQKLIRSIQSINLDTNQTSDMREEQSSSGLVLCTTSVGTRLAVIIEAQPLYAGVYLPYAMFSQSHPWTAGPYPSWQRSEKYLYGPNELTPQKKKKLRRTRKKIIE